MTLLTSISYWGWLIAGLVLLALELLAPTTFFLWLGVSALTTALIVFFMPEITWQIQFFLFSMLSVFSIVLSRRFLVRRQTRSEVPNLNRRAQQYIGRVCTVSEAIEHGQGKVRIDDTHWIVTGPDLEIDTEVRITGANGPVFTVETIDGDNDT